MNYKINIIYIFIQIKSRLKNLSKNFFKINYILIKIKNINNFIFKIIIKLIKLKIKKVFLK